MRKALWIGVAASPLATLYCLAAIVQAGSIYTGERAQRNLMVWGTLLTLCLVILIACSVILLRTKVPKLNTSTSMLEKSRELTSWIATAMNTIHFPSDNRRRIAAACFAVVQEHHTAIVLLVDQGAASPAFSLARSVYEGYIRGAWLAYCASDDQLASFMAGNEPPKQSELIAALEKLPGYESLILSRVRVESWKALCDYAHIGSRMVTCWITSESIEPNFQEAEINELLTFTGAIALVSAVDLCNIAENESLAQKVLEKCKLFSWAKD